MADLTARPDHWTDSLPGNWQQAINTHPILNALGRALSRQSPDMTRGIEHDQYGSVSDRNWLLEAARGGPPKLNPLAAEMLDKGGLLANFLGPGVKLPAAAPKPTGIRAYHGSPHDFNAERLVKFPDGRTEYIVGTPDRLPDIPAGAQALKDFPLGRFREDKIGTGEGAQAYGRGVAYVAESEGVARSYRDTLSRGGTSSQLSAADQARLEWSQPFLEAANWNRTTAAELAEKAAKGSLFKRPDPLQAQRFQRAADFLRDERMPIGNPGRMYEVRINADPEQFLDWDKPLAQQPEAVRRALDAAGLVPWKTRNPLGIEYGNLSRDSALRLSGQGRRPMEPDMSATGADLINWEVGAGRPVAKQENSERLREAGIPGVKYLDQGSRAAGQGSRNYVVFDDKLIEILRKYGLWPLVPAGTAAALNQQEPPL